MAASGTGHAPKAFDASWYRNPLMSPLNLLYAIAIFLGSFLLFLVEPMAAKRLVPLLGGSAAVWTTCLVFFQIALLLGYLCAHWLATRLRPRAQALAYTGLLGICLLQAVLNLQPQLHASTEHPIRSVFLLLTTLIGLPFLALSATNPLLQAWYARGHGRGGEASAAGAPAPPYRLFALSNFGSLLALVIYPWLVEPRFSLHVQGLIWLAGFVVFALACAGIALVSGRRGAAAVEFGKAASGAAAEPQRPIGDRILWLLLAACGSLLLCAMTNHISQNIAAIPLLWIVPLIMYLLSFVVAFSRGPWLPGLLRIRIPGLRVSVGRMCLLGFAWVSLWGLVFMLSDTRLEIPLIVSIPFYCGTLFILCLFCHAELHRLRPSPSHATSFYLLIAAGGALGSIFVGVLAPLVFSGSYELACSLVFTALLALAVTWRAGIGWRIFWSAVSVAIVAILVFYHPHDDGERNLVRMRNFYGTLRVSEELDPPFTEVTRTLTHGVIIHGTQIFTDELRNTPTTYYSHDSGVGLALDFCCADRPRRVGLIGLGAGTLAAYGRKGDVFRFYDINPLVPRIARTWFSYLRDSAATIEIVPGDARLSLAAEPPQNYDVLVVDAFSGDAIPVHLLTSQALELYQRHLAPGGIIAVHISNRYLDLGPVVQQESKHAGLQAVWVNVSQDDDSTGAFGSDWVLVTANTEFLSRKEVDEVSDPVPEQPGLRLWTDDYNSVLPLLKWREANATDQPDQPDAQEPEPPKKPDPQKKPDPPK
jgi:spermidine synthase